MRFPPLPARPLIQALSLLAGLLVGAAQAASAGSDPVAVALAGVERAATLPSLPASAETQTVLEQDEPQLRARLLVASPMGEDASRRVGVLLDLKPGWHVYWRNPGGTGIAPELGLSADGYRVGEIDWPAPQTFEEADGLFTTWGYEGSVLLSAAMIPDPQAAGARGERVRTRARVLICRTQCVPAAFELEAPLDPVLSSRDQQVVDRLFEASLARVPIRAETIGLGASAHWTQPSPSADAPRSLELRLATCGGLRERCPVLASATDSTLFVPIEGETFEYSPARVVREAPGTGEFVLAIDATRLEDGPDRLWGLVPIRDAQGRLHHAELDVPIAEARADLAATGVSASPLRWLQVFLLAMLGGLILNGMPCVLPVLAIKVVAVAHMAERDPREVRLHGIAYTGGVLASMGLLAAIVLGLRAAGHSVGWGFQFQEPLFVAAIAALLVGFALNLFGVFEIELGQGRLATIGQGSTGFQRSVFEGLLAVVLATPCTAPFLGTAVGFAFASSGAGIAAIFLAIGFGLASPFLLVSFFPSYARFIPRSGPWMNQLRAGLGFSLLATVVWLLWVLGQSGGAGSVVSMTGALLLLAFVLWGFGQLQPLRSPWLGRLGAVALAGLCLAGFNWIELDRAAAPAGELASSPGAPPASTPAEDGWQPYSETAVADALAAGRPAFVVFTADWCITCKVNESTVLRRERVLEALEARRFALFEADWTRRDETIRRKLAQFGRAGVPLYLVYRPDRPSQPEVLSELLSQREILAAIETPDARRL